MTIRVKEFLTMRQKHTCTHNTSLGKKTGVSYEKRSSRARVVSYEKEIQSNST